MKNTQARSFISLPSQPTLSAIAMILISTCISVSALASPITQGDPLSASLGWEVDMGSARDPGDRDGSMGVEHQDQVWGYNGGIVTGWLQKVGSPFKVMKAALEPTSMRTTLGVSGLA